MELDFEVLNIAHTSLFLTVDIIIEIGRSHSFELVLLDYDVLRSDVDQSVEVGTRLKHFALVGDGAHLICAHVPHTIAFVFSSWSSQS